MSCVFALVEDLNDVYERTSGNTAALRHASHQERGGGSGGDARGGGTGSMELRALVVSALAVVNALAA